MNSEPGNTENPPETGQGRTNRPFRAAAILLPPALLLFGVWILLIADYLFEAAFIFAVMASLAYFAVHRFRGRMPKDGRGRQALIHRR